MSKSKSKKKMTKAQGQLVTDPNVTTYIKGLAILFGSKYKSVGVDEFYSIGIAAACEEAMRYKRNSDATFITYITVYVVGAMVRYVQKYVDGMYLDKQERFFANICSIEEFKRGGRDDKETINTEEILSAEFIDEDERQDLIHERVESILSKLTVEEREIITIRYGYLDNHGEAVEEYMKKHKIRKSVFYERAKVVEKKMVALAEEQSKNN